MMNRRALLPLLAGLFWASQTAAADPPCDQYPQPQQPRCEKVWKQLNQESVADISRFGLDQLKRRQEGKISQEQHLKENMEFIKQSTDKRLKLLSERMAQEQEPRQHPAEKPLQR